MCVQYIAISVSFHNYNNYVHSSKLLPYWKYLIVKVMLLLKVYYCHKHLMLFSLLPSCCISIYTHRGALSDMQSVIDVTTTTIQTAKIHITTKLQFQRMLLQEFCWMDWSQQLAYCLNCCINVISFYVNLK